MRPVSKTIALAASVALFASSTAVVADPAPQAQPVQASAPNAWMMLSTLSGAQSVGLAGANTAANQHDDSAPPPVSAGAGAMSDGAGPLIPIAIWWGLIALALTHSGSGGAPNSPS